MARNVVDELVVRLTADASRLQAELGKAETQAKTGATRIGTSFAAAFKQASRFGLAAATGITALSTALTTAANKAAAYADQIDKTAIRTRLSRGALQELAFAADQAGVEFTAIEANIRAFTGRLAEAEKGSTVVAGTFDRLGVSLRNQNGSLRNTETLFLDTIKALSGIENETERAALAVQAFGEQGSALLPFLNLGATGLDDLRAKARELGLVLDDQAIGTLVEYKDQLSAFQQQAGAAGRELATQFLPILTEGLLPALEAALRVFRNLPEPVQRGATALTGLGVAAGAAAAAFRVLGISLAPLFGPAGIALAAGSVIAAIAFALSGGGNSLVAAAEDGADALAGGDAGSLASAIGEVAGELDGELKEKLVAAQEELAETGRIGVAAAQDIERAFATVLARQGISRGLLGAFPTSAATGLDLAGNASLLGAGAVPGVGQDVTARLAVGDLEGALALVNQALDALTSNFAIIDRGVLAGLARFRDELAAGVRAVAEAEAFVPSALGSGGGSRGGASAPDGSADDPFFVNPYGTPFGNQRDPLTGSASFQRGTASPANPDTAFVQSILDADAAVNTFQTTLENLAAAGRAASVQQADAAAAVRTAAALEQAARDERGLTSFGFTLEALARQGREAALENRALEEAREAEIETVRRSGQELEDIFRSGRIVQAIETRRGIEERAAAQAEEAAAALQAFQTSIENLARAGRAASVDAAGFRRVVADPFAGAPGLNPGRQFQMDRRAGGAAVPIGFDVGAIEDATNALVRGAFETREAIVTAGVQFASDLAGAIKSGSPSGIFGALTGGIGSIISIFDPLAGSIFGLVGKLFGGLIPDPNQGESEAARAAGARPGGAPAIELNLSVFQNLAVNSLTGGDRAAVDGLLDQTVSRIESVLVSFGQRLTAVEARTA